MRLAVALLVVVACRTPPERSPQPRLADASIDAAIDASADAAVAEIDKPCDWNRPDPENPRCAPEHMPLMRCRDVNGPNDRFPKCLADDKVVELKKDPVVVKIKRRGALTDRGTSIIVDGGSNRGVDKSWRVEVLDAKQRPLRGGQGSISRLDAEEMEIVVRLTPDQIDMQAKSVRLTPP
jgi:hypothetical protein